MYDLVEKDIKRMKTSVFNVKTSWEKFEEIMATLLDILYLNLNLSLDMPSISQLIQQMSASKLLML